MADDIRAIEGENLEVAGDDIELTDETATDVDELDTTIDFSDVNTRLFQRREVIVNEIKELDEQGPGDSPEDWAAERALLNSRLDAVNTEIYETNIGLIRSWVRTFSRSATRANIEEFEAAATLGFVRAMNGFNWRKGKFGQWAWKQIQRETIRSVRDAEHPNMMPGDFERRGEIRKTYEALVAESGDGSFVPTYAQVAARLDITVDQVTRVLAAPRLTSLQDRVGEDSDTERGDLIEDDSPAFEDNLMSSMTLRALEEYGLPELDVRELYVMIRRAGLDGESRQCLNSIGEQLGLSREAVRQIEAKAESKIAHPIILNRVLRHGRSAA